MNDRDRDHDVPRLQPWLVVSMAAFLPLLLELFVPVGWMWYLLSLSGLTLLIGVALLVAQEGERTRRHAQCSRDQRSSNPQPLCRNPGGAVASPP